MVERVAVKRKRSPPKIHLVKIMRLEEHVAMVFNEHLDLINRTLYLTSVHSDTEGNESGIDASISDFCLKAMDLLEKQDRNSPIKIVLSSFGGSVYHSFGIYDRIKLSPCRTIIYGFGPIMSAGSLILQAGDERLIAPNATMMLHYADSSIPSTRDPSFDSEVKEYKLLNNRLLEIYLERIKKTGKSVDKAWFNRQICKTYYLPASEVVARGLADGVIAKL